MATYNWTGAASTIIGTTTNWNPTAVFPSGATDLFVFTSGATQGPTTGTISGGFTSMRMESVYTLNSSTISITPSATTNFGGYNNTSAPDSTVCSIYIAPSKIFDANQPSSTNNFTYGSATNNELKLYVDTGGEFRVRQYGGSVGYINKLGPGTVYLAYGGGTITAPASTKSIHITGGTVAVRGIDYAATGNSILGSSGTLQFNSGSAVFQVGATATTRTFGYTLNLGSGATFDVGSGATLNFSNNPTTLGGTLTIGPGTGTLGFTNASGFTFSASTNFTGAATLTVPSGTTFTGSSISGAGTINANGCNLGNNSLINASTHTGSITGNVTILGGASTFASNFTGGVTIGGGIITLTGASSGSITQVGNFSTLTVKNNISGGGGGSTTLFQSATLVFETSNAGFATNRTIAATGTTSVLLKDTATLNSPISSTDTTIITLRTDDTSACTYSGAISTNQASGSFKIMAKNDGTLTFSGSASGTNSGRPFALNADSGYGGKIVVTGSGFTNASPITLSRGTLHLNRTSAIGLGGGLTASSGATVACSSAGAYAAQLTGALNLAAGSTLRFGAPA